MEHKITTVIFAHGDAIETINRHLPIWKEYTDNLLIVSPKDNPCILEGIDCLSIGKRQHHGPHTLARHLFAMKTALGYESDFYVFLEYDAIMLKRPEPRPIIQGNLFNENAFLKKEDSLVHGECFMHFPWIFPAEKLKEFVKKVDLSVSDHPVEEKRYAHDIWLIQKLKNLNFEVYNLLNSEKNIAEGNSCNSFDTPKRIEDVVYSVKQGAYALHGIKMEDVLNQILNARKDFLNPKKVYTYHDDINFLNQNELLDLWKQSWQQKGFDAVVLTRDDAKKSSFYNEFLNGVKYIHAAITGCEISEYGLSCYLRWLAYSTQNISSRFLVSDYDIINKNFQIEELASLPKENLFFMDGYCPCLAYGSPEDFLTLCKDIVGVSIKNKLELKLSYKDKKNGCYHDQEFISLNQEREKYKICHENQKYVRLYIKGDDGLETAKIYHVAHRSIYESKERFPELKNIDSDSLRLRFIEEILNM